MEFKIVKNKILQIAKENNACSDQRILAEQSENYKDLLKVVTNNINFCYSAGIFSKEILEMMPNEELINANIYFNKKNIIQNEGNAYYFNSTSEHYGSSTSKHYGSSTSEHYGSSTSEHYGSSTSEHYDSSTSEHYDSSTSEHYSSSTSEHYDSSTSKHYGSSTSEHYGSSTSEHYGSSTSKHYDSSTSEHYDSSTYGSIYKVNDFTVIKDKAILRERSTGNIYLKKDAFNVILID